MASKTEHYGLTKPDETDFYDIAVFNENADIIDAALYEVRDADYDTAGSADTVQKNLDAHTGNADIHITTTTYTATIPTSGWSDTAPYTVDVSVPGMLETDNPSVGIVQTGTLDADLALQEAFGTVGRIVTNKDTITVYCYEETPGVEILIQLKVVR